MEMQESLQQLTGSEASVIGRQSFGAGETRGYVLKEITLLIV